MRSRSLVHGVAPWHSASVKITAEPARQGTVWIREWSTPLSKVFISSGIGKLALWLPGTQAKPPSSSLTSVRLNATTVWPLKMRPLKWRYISVMSWPLLSNDPPPCIRRPANPLRRM